MEMDVVTLLIRELDQLREQVTKLETITPVQPTIFAPEQEQRFNRLCKKFITTDLVQSLHDRDLTATEAYAALIELQQLEIRELDQKLTFETFKSKDLSNQLDYCDKERHELTKENDAQRAELVLLNAQNLAYKRQVDDLKKELTEGTQVNALKKEVTRLEDILNPLVVEAEKRKQLWRQVFVWTKQLATDPKCNLPRDFQDLVEKSQWAFGPLFRQGEEPPNKQQKRH